MLHDAFERDRVRTGLVEAITKLCRNGLNYSSELCVEGLLGITLDNKEVLLVNIKEIIKGKKDGRFYKNSFGSELFSSEQQGGTSLYDKPLDFSSKIRSATKDSGHSSCPDLRPVRAGRKRKPKHISETIILDNEDEEVLVEDPLPNSTNLQPNAIDFSTKSCKPQVPITTPVKRIPEVNTFASRNTPSPLGRGSPCLGPASPPSPIGSGNKAFSPAISHNSSIPQTTLVTPSAKKPKLMQAPFRSQLPENNENTRLGTQTNDNTLMAEHSPGKDLTVPDKIGNLIQNAVDSVVETVHSNLVQSHASKSSTDSLQNTLKTAVRFAHGDSYLKHDDIAWGSMVGDRPLSPNEPGRLVIVEPSGEDNDTNHDENSDTNNTENNIDSKSGGNNVVKREDDALSSCSSSRSLQTTPDPCKQQSVSTISVFFQLYSSYWRHVKY